MKVNYLKGKVIMTFKTNVPDRWIDNPDSLPLKGLTEPDDGDKKQRGKSIDLKTSAIKVNQHLQTASLSHATFQASKTRENFRSFGGSKEDLGSSEKSQRVFHLSQNSTTRERNNNEVIHLD